MEKEVGNDHLQAEELNGVEKHFEDTLKNNGEREETEIRLISDEDKFMETGNEQQKEEEEREKREEIEGEKREETEPTEGMEGNKVKVVDEEKVEVAKVEVVDEEKVEVADEEKTYVEEKGKKEKEKEGNTAEVAGNTDEVTLCGNTADRGSCFVSKAISNLRSLAFHCVSSGNGTFDFHSWASGFAFGSVLTCCVVVISTKHYSK